MLAAVRMTISLLKLRIGVAVAASALAATATPILSFRSEMVMRTAASINASPSSPLTHVSVEQPEFGQIFPVDKVVEHEGNEEDGDQYDRARQLDRTLATIMRDCCSAARVQREGEFVATGDLLTEQNRADDNDHEDGATERSDNGGHTVKAHHQKCAG